jgi:hypothetical protein
MQQQPMIRCPDNRRSPDDITGCGALVPDVRDKDGTVDCPNCGLFWQPESQPKEEHTMTEQHRKISFYTIKQVQASDLGDLQRGMRNNWLVVRIDGKWREVFDVWSDNDDPATLFGDNDYTRMINEWLETESPLWTVVRYLVEEKSKEQISDALHAFRYRDLVEVQVPEEGFEWRE